MASTALPPVPPGIDLNADRGPHIVASAATMIILSTIFVILRLISRYLSRAGLWWDDTLLVASLITSYGPSICVIVSEKINGFGRHLWVLPDPQQNTLVFLKILYIYIEFYYASVVLIKLAILTFYRRIFPVSEIRVWLYISYAVVGMFAIATFGATTFQCHPIHAFWSVEHNSEHCVSGDNILIIPGAFNVVLDFAIIIIPIPLLWRLRTTTYQKGVLTGIFSCAGFVCIISIIRVAVLSRIKEFDVTWNYVDAALWSIAEPAVGIVAACLPSLRPLAAIIWKGNHHGPTFNLSKSSTKKSAQQGSSVSSRTVWGREKQSDFERIEDGGGKWGHNADIRGGVRPIGETGDNISLEELNPTHGGIRVKNEVVVTTENWGYDDRLF